MSPLHPCDRTTKPLNDAEPCFRPGFLFPVALSELLPVIDPRARFRAIEPFIVVSVGQSCNPGDSLSCEARELSRAESHLPGNVADTKAAS